MHTCITLGINFVKMYETGDTMAAVVNGIFNNLSYYYHYVLIEHDVLKNTWVKLYI